MFTQSNRFAGCARNAGLEAAKGKYVVFWDSDAFFEKKALETMFRKCEQMKAQMSAMLQVLYDASSKSVGGKLPDDSFYHTGS